jgi:hypothetical protein
MGITVLCVKEEGGMRLFVSSEYSVTKERDTGGRVLPDQKWQHPEATALRYTEFGKFDCPSSFGGFMDSWLHLGAGEFGGHVRFISEDAAAILKGRRQSWNDKIDADETHQQEMEAERERERYLEHCLEEQRRAPVYDWCNRCGRSQEVCKNPAHRGNRCMRCCGGVGEASNRHCVNCLDLPYREMREKALGEPIIYEGESEHETVS